MHRMQIEEKIRRGRNQKTFRRREVGKKWKAKHEKEQRIEP